jgi:MoxR-like ATPase
MTIAEVLSTSGAENRRGHEHASALMTRIIDGVASVLLGQEAAVRQVVAAFAAGGHVLLEDVPGTGKTTLAKAMARALSGTYQRIQFTPDLLPADITGGNVFNARTSEFEFRPGPIFTQILLADEVNRASPRTQSALLEAMAEGQVSIDGERRILDDAFFVIATQNPVEFQGTYPLPESQMDRFHIRLSLGYVSADKEVEILESNQDGVVVEDLAPCVDSEQQRFIREQVTKVVVSHELKRYIVDLVTATRTHGSVRVGASPRASIALMRMAQAMALVEGSDFVTPRLIQQAFAPVIAHRLVLERGLGLEESRAVELIEQVIDEVPVPI